MKNCYLVKWSRREGEATLSGICAVFTDRRAATRHAQARGRAVSGNLYEVEIVALNPHVWTRALKSQAGSGGRK